MSARPALRPHIIGFDYLRLLAMAGVTVQHGLSVIGHYEWTQIAPGCTLGQFGVAVFCGLAGWFAMDNRPIADARPDAQGNRFRSIFGLIGGGNALSPAGRGLGEGGNVVKSRLFFRSADRMSPHPEPAAPPSPRRGEGSRPGDWIIARLIRLFPAYWAATLLAFALALAVGRPITAGLFASQMLGLGYFTHGMELVNVVSWFISLILLCYALTALARLSSWPRLCLAAFALAALALAASGTETVLARHVLTFTAAAAVAGAGRFWLAPVIGGAVVIAAITVAPALLVTGTALILVWLFQTRIWPVAPLVGTTAAYVYEYFLLHGLFLHAGVKFVGPSAAGLTVGLIAAIPAVMLLKRFANAVATRWRFTLARKPAPAPAGKPPPG